MAQFGIGRNKELTHHISLSLRQVVWIGRVVRCYTPRTERRMEILISNQGIDICVAHGRSFWCVPEPFLWELATFAKGKLNTLSMHGCVVDHAETAIFVHVH